MNTTPNQPVRLLIVDDHVIIRRGLKFLLESNFRIDDCHETDSCLDLKRMLSTHDFTHVILDMQLNDGNVIEILSEILENYPNIPILIYTMSPEEIYGPRLINMGVAGFLNKQVSEQEVIEALKTFFSGKPYISSNLKEIMETKRQAEKYNISNKGLSERELVVLQYLLKGLGIKEISNKLNIKSSTVATFKARIFNKLGVSNIIELKDVAELYSVKPTAN